MPGKPENTIKPFKAFLVHYNNLWQRLCDG